MTNDVLIKVRNLLHRGYRLISYPLSGSLKTILSPVKSIIIQECKEEIEMIELEAIENSIIRYQRLIKSRGVDLRHKKDHEKIDFFLLKSALAEK